MGSALLVALLLWAVTLWRLPVFRRNSTQHSHTMQRSLAITLGALAASMTFDVPAVKQSLDALVGFQGLAPLLKHLLAVFSAATCLDFVIAVVRPHGLARRFRRAALLTAVALMIVFYTLANARPITQALPAGGSYSAYAVLYMVIFTLYIGTAMVVATWLFLGGARHSGTGWGRLGLNLLSLGTAIGSLYALQRIVFIAVNLLTDTRHPVMENRISTSLRVAAITTIAVGICVPPLSVAAKTFRSWKALRELEPLWHGVTQSAPQVILKTQPSAWQVRRRLEVRLIEIGDAALRLREYVPASVQHKAKQQAAEAGVPEAEQDAVAEAVWLAAAARSAPHSTPAIGGKGHPTPGGTDLPREEELAWQLQVSRACMTPLVAKLAAQAQPPLLLPGDDPGMFLHDL